MTTEVPLETLTRFWAKTTHDKIHLPRAYHPLLCHMVDSAAVALLIWDKVLSSAVKERIAEAFGATGKVARFIVAWIAGLHDLGKASPPFIFRKSAKYLHALYEPTVFSLSQFRNREVPPPDAAWHGFVTAVTLPTVLQDFGMPQQLAVCISELIGGHHGTFAASGTVNDLQKKLKSGAAETGNRNWQTARREIAVALTQLLEAPADLSMLRNSVLDRGSTMILAGLVSVADWVASNSTYFPCEVNDAGTDEWKKLDPVQYFEKAKGNARKALQKLGWLGWPIAKAKKEFGDLFPTLKNWQPRPAQQAAQTVAESLSESGLVVIEAPMGEGKTEAAIYLADRWNVELNQRGIYFALPTMATSNQMFGRVCEYFSTRFPGTNAAVYLLHGHATLMADFKKVLADKAKALAIKNVYCDDRQSKCKGDVLAADWFIHRKRGLLVPFGVGTVDQVLMAALRTRHVFVRLFGLAHRTIIIDEVHAYDAYMSALLERLLEWLGALRSPVILLSATLPSDKRQALVNAYLRGQSGDRDFNQSLPQTAYPRITWTQGGQIYSQPLPEDKSGQKDEKQSKPNLLVEWVDGSIAQQDEPFPLGEMLMSALAEGGCAAVICNTVDRAQKMYGALFTYFEQCAADGKEAPELGLFHARFLFEDREEREKLALWCFGKKDKVVEFAENDQRKVERPRRFVLVATQVIEQSLDLDFDLMVSDFAPLDLILQRSGRVWRHEDNERYAIKQPTLWLCRPEIVNEVPRFDEGTEVVYSPDDGSNRRRKEEERVVPHVLLRSWLTLRESKNTNGFSDSFSICISAEIEKLIEETYRRKDCPADLPEIVQTAWIASWQEYERSIASQTDKAESKMFNEPYYRGFLGDYFKDPKEEDSPEIHQSHQALTRLGDSIGIICLNQSDSFNLKIEPDHEQTEKLLRRSVSISRKDVVWKLRAEQDEELMPKGWQKSPPLRHYRRIVLGRLTAGYVFRVDEKLGVLIEKVEKES